MKLTKESNKLIAFFIKNNCILPIKQTNKSNAILSELYEDIKNGVSYIDELKTKFGDHFYKLKVNNITNIQQIPRPATFPPNAFPPEVRTHIDEHSIGSLSYSFHLFKRNINIIFLVEDNYVEKIIEKYNTYVDYMLVWLYIIDKYSSKKCAQSLKVFVYHTNLLKTLPGSNIDILNENNVNTAFTRTCPSDSEIVVFRKEEWFKVFIHETFHNFGLDFSDLNISAYTQRILSIFPVNSEVNLYEAYAEFWARIMNSLFCSFINLKNKNDVNEFLTNAEFFINCERIFSFFQMVKVLQFMGLTYNDLYKKNMLSSNLRKTLYKEDTNVLSYYVITMILINNYQGFIMWCNENNNSLLNFKKTTNNLNSFCDFIESKYKSKLLLNCIECTEKLLEKVKNNKHKHKHAPYLLKNLRMTLCELG